MKKFILPFILIMILGVSGANAQCPMCRGAVETNIKQGGEKGRGLNKGILYLLAMPYLAAATFGVIYFKRKKQVG